MIKTKQKKSVKEYFKSFGRYFAERSKSSIATSVIMALYVAFCIGSLIYFVIIGRGRDCLVSVAYLIIAPIFYLAEFNLKIRSPLLYTLFVIVFCTFCFLGASYNFYTIIPMLDDILHACWGILFSTLGFCIIKSLMGEPKSTNQFVAYLLFSIGFCMLLSIIWEIYEYACDSLMANFDMQQDTIVDHIHSFGMYPDPFNPKPDNLHTWQVEGIDHTILYDAAGNPIATIPGYLDIGLHDTMWDIIWCVITTCALCVVLSIDRKAGGKLYPHIIPVYVGKEGKAEEISQEIEEVEETAEQEEREEQDESGETAQEYTCEIEKEVEKV